MKWKTPVVYRFIDYLKGDGGDVVGSVSIVRKFSSVLLLDET